MSSEPYAIPPKDRAFEGILWYIKQYDLQGGDRLPAERVLCEELGVSRTALRAAITRLISCGTLESRRGSGTFDYADVLQCEIVETGNPEDVPEVSKRELAQQILINPAQATKNNAAKRNMCLGMGVIVAVQTGEDEISKLEIPVTAGEVKRDSGLYRSYRNVAEQIKEAFDAMGRPEQ